MAKQKPQSKKTPCEDGGDELLPWSLPISAASATDFTIRVCFANARVRLWIQPEPIGTALPLVDETGKSDVKVRLPSLSAGRYQLFWSVQTPALKWQTRADLIVDGVTRFRRRKTSDGENPVNMGTLALVVQS